ncbi:hypothetical protein ONS95_001287 [Cadophora gregata]|uniref:uncharacterized protein n=1 Tax=Cadophora gregata TaxID=51156 RepID=UPI0026DC652C|nr:uncharacterized protein ONS95_001287 [Cadophora gregata]KAK0129360.1 hypothetical protein ONS95_001287 [Cadophora gregata]
MPSLRKLMPPCSPTSTSTPSPLSAPSPSAVPANKTTTTTKKTTTSPNGTKTITKTIKTTASTSTAKSSNTTSKIPVSENKNGTDREKDEINDGIEIVGPGSNPLTNKTWMGDEIPIMGRGMVPAIVGEEQLSPEEMARMGIVPQGRWVKVGTTTVRTVKRTVRKTAVKGENSDAKDKEEEGVENIKGKRKEKEKVVEREGKKSVIIGGKAVKGRSPENKTKGRDKEEGKARGKVSEKEKEKGTRKTAM